MKKMALMLYGNRRISAQSDRSLFLHYILQYSLILKTSKGPDQAAPVYMLIWAFVSCIGDKGTSPSQCFIYVKCSKISYNKISDKMAYANNADPYQTTEGAV